MIDRFISTHFKLGEFTCKCGCETPEILIPRIEALAQVIDAQFRSPLGPTKIISGYRCTAHNLREGGSRESRHVFGDAADIAVYDLKTGAWILGLWLAGWASAKMDAGELLAGGLGTYASKPYTLHFDMRGTVARWRKP